jgi:hypothetical protein
LACVKARAFFIFLQKNFHSRKNRWSKAAQSHENTDEKAAMAAKVSAFIALSFR